eukprot:gene12199-15327_t
MYYVRSCRQRNKGEGQGPREGCGQAYMQLWPVSQLPPLQVPAHDVLYQELQAKEQGEGQGPTGGCGQVCQMGFGVPGGAADQHICAFGQLASYLHHGCQLTMYYVRSCRQRNKGGSQGPRGGCGQVCQMGDRAPGGLWTSTYAIWTVSQLPPPQVPAHDVLYQELQAKEQGEGQGPRGGCGQVCQMGDRAPGGLWTSVLDGGQGPRGGCGQVC